MLTVTSLSGFGGGASGIEVLNVSTLIDVTSNLSTYTTSIDIGTAETGRVVFALIWCRDDAGGATLDSVTINGESATLIGEIAGSDSGGTKTAAVYAAVVDAGSGAQDIVTNWSTTMSGHSVQAIACRGVQSLAATDTLTEDDTAVTVYLDASTLDVEAGGLILAIAGTDTSGRTATWASLTESGDESSGEHSTTAAYAAYNSAQSVNVRTTWNGSSDGSAIAVAVR